MNVDVRWCRLDQVESGVDSATINGLLCEGELARLASLRQAADRRRFVGVRLLLRAAVSERADCDPSDVTLRQLCPDCGGPHGRPFVSTPGRRGIAVSMAHSGLLAIVALASRPVGVDIEVIPDGDSSTRAGCGTAGVGLTTWVRKEAVLKATGHGLGVDPGLVGLSAHDVAPRLISWEGPGRTPSLRIADVATAPGYVASVARFGRGPLRADVRAMTIRVPPV